MRVYVCVHVLCVGLCVSGVCACVCVCACGVCGAMCVSGVCACICMRACGVCGAVCMWCVCAGVSKNTMFYHILTGSIDVLFTTRVRSERVGSQER